MCVCNVDMCLKERCCNMVEPIILANLAELVYMSVYVVDFDC